MMEMYELAVERTRRKWTRPTQTVLRWEQTCLGVSDEVIYVAVAWAKSEDEPE